MQQRFVSNEHRGTRAMPSRLRSLDLFSGIGGMTLALLPVAKPVAYCEIDASAVAVLRDNMRNGRLPRAPIATDVREVTAAALPGKVDIVLAGFPCTGFSNSGLRRGFSDPGSRLFYEVLRIYDDLASAQPAQPPMLFLENVPSVMSMGRKAIARELSVKRGLEVRWAIVGASDVGAPHRRRRWFCLAVPKASVGRRIPVQRDRERFDWSREPVARTSRCADSRPRHGLLGNAVVPEAAWSAFAYLANAFRDPATDPVRRISRLEATPEESRLAGFVRAGDAAWSPAAAFPRRRCSVRGITLVPDAYRSRGPPKSTHRAGSIKAEPVHLTHWATPTRTDAWRISAQHLTDRSAGQLHTQVRFEARTRDREQPVSAEFVEYLMGFPRGWTVGGRSPPTTPRSRQKNGVDKADNTE